MIVSPLALICFIRCLVRSVWKMHPVMGHNFYIRNPIEGQPCVVTVMKCTTCGQVICGWFPCKSCGYKEPT